MNDTFNVLNVSSKTFEISTNGIAWPYDKSTLFKNSKDGNTT